MDGILLSPRTCAWAGYLNEPHLSETQDPSINSRLPCNTLDPWNLSRIEYAIRNPAIRKTNIESKDQLAGGTAVWCLKGHIVRSRHFPLGEGGHANLRVSPCAGRANQV